MSQAVWTGSITFGLVAIPVKLYPATEPKDVRFHLYDRRTGRRVRYERVTHAEDPEIFTPELSEPVAPVDRAAPVEQADIRPAREIAPAPFAEPPLPARGVERDDVLRGFELPGGELVTITDAELGAIAPERSRTIDIEEFVHLAEIDPVFYEKSYLVGPVHGAGAEKPYVLLLKAMRSAGMVGIGRFVLRTKPHLVAIRPRDKTLALETLFFGDEVRSADEHTLGVLDLPIAERELKTARQLIAAMATSWAPERHADTYRDELLEMLRSKAPEAAPPATQTIAAGRIEDLMDVLRASVEAAKRKRAAKPSASKRAG